MTLESPKYYADINLLDEEQIFNFPLNFEQMEIQEEINLSDNIYFLSRLPSKGLSKDNITIPNKTQEKKRSDNSLLILDDFESFYNNIFADIKEQNAINSDKEENKNPSFNLNLDYENKFVYSFVEDEKLIKIENNEQTLKKKLEKEKIFGIFKEKKGEKTIQKTNQNIRPKINHRKKKNKDYIDTSDKCFPFNSGRGIFLNSNKKDEESLFSTNDNSNSAYANWKDISLKNIRNSEENLNYIIEKEDKLNDKYRQIISDTLNFKFKTKKYFVTPEGKKKKVKKIRKFKSDDIRKKIKARFHKELKNIINENLKKAGSKELLDFLPQCFISNVSKRANSDYLHWTYKDLLSTNFAVELKKEEFRNIQVGQNKYKKNIEVLKYLERNPDICKSSGFDLIMNMKYEEIINNYFESIQFEDSLVQLKEEKESPEYIMEYIKIAKSYLNFYRNEIEIEDKKEINEKMLEEEENKDNEEDIEEF